MKGTPPVPRAVLVTVGDELLLGRTVDTNRAWLGQELASLGVDVLSGATVGDQDPDIQGAVRAGLAGADLVLVTGGLGPTRDDRTREAVAALLECPLEVDPILLGLLEERFRARGYEHLPQKNVSQALVPRGATILRNPQGTAPGLAMESGKALVVLLPGVPREMKAIVQGDLTDLLRRRLGERLRPVHHHTLHTTGIPESDLAGRVEELLPADLGPLTLAFLPELTGVDLRLTARGVQGGEAERWFHAVEEALAPVLDEFGFHAESGDLVEALGRALQEQGRHLAVAESCTGGLVARRLTERPGSSAYFLGGVVSYANEVKVRVLGVDPVIMERAGAVSEEVVRQMVQGVSKALGTQTALAVTGIAGPEGGSVEKPVGTVWYAALVDGVVQTRREVFVGDRHAIRERAAQAVMALLLRRLEARR